MKTVCVDFDGTLHPYTAGWVGVVPADEPPTDGARAFLQWCKTSGFRVVVQSARASFPEGKGAIEQWIAKWLPPDEVAEVTAVKPAAVAYVDDRAVPFTGDWHDVAVGVQALS